MKTEYNLGEVGHYVMALCIIDILGHQLHFQLSLLHEVYLGIRLGAASIHYNRSIGKDFFGQLHNLILYAHDHVQPPLERTRHMRKICCMCMS